MLGRGWRLRDLLGSLRACSDAPVTFICSPNDSETLAVCNDSGEDTIVTHWQPDRGDYARKINLGYRETQEPFVFCGASDLWFQDGWDRQALAVADRTGAGVVGTQDTANPLVKRGVQSTHPLVRRAYVEEFGSATFDQTGDVYCELYDHQYIDVELCETAKLRQRWAFAKRAIVKHLHPHWGTAPDDDTYAKAMRKVNDDRQLYVQRMKRQQTVWARQRRTAAL